MKLLVKILVSALLIPAACLLLSCEETPLDSTKGYISVSVLDNDSEHTPVFGIEITIMPGDFTQTTDENGKCTFAVDPGDYEVHTVVPGPGPGRIYNESISVLAGRISEITLEACTVCV
ncbi:MAG: hypothetical protein K9M55_00395 [Candidatus Marinimicrobia bacterium]|nr:hypothetical protein [Candidatus Neomarinimicrobiota bacterium]